MEGDAALACFTRRNLSGVSVPPHKVISGEMIAAQTKAPAWTVDLQANLSGTEDEECRQ